MTIQIISDNGAKLIAIPLLATIGWVVNLAWVASILDPEPIISITRLVWISAVWWLSFTGIMITTTIIMLYDKRVKKRETEKEWRRRA